MGKFLRLVSASAKFGWKAGICYSAYMYKYSMYNACRTTCSTKLVCPVWLSIANVRAGQGQGKAASECRPALVQCNATLTTDPLF